MATVLITLGGLLLVGLATHELGRRTRLPRVTLLLAFGFLCGPSGLDLLPRMTETWFPLISHMALGLVGFLLGEKLTSAALREKGREVIGISTAVVLVTAGVVALGLTLLGVPPAVALLLGAIATSTDPAASSDVVHEAGADGPFSRVLLGVVAIDDAWGLVAFSAMLAAAQALGDAGAGLEPLRDGAWELVGSVALGTALGVPMAYLTGRIQPGEPTLAEALGLIFLCVGLSLWLEVSFLLAAMVLGICVANLARHHTRPFHAIENIEWPFMVLFFVLAGAALDLRALPTLGGLTLAYVALRGVARPLGAWLGGRASGSDALVRRWMGVALLPQAGVALGMALVASQRLPTAAQTILPVVIASTVLFEILGPLATRRALERVGEIPARRDRVGTRHHPVS